MARNGMIFKVYCLVKRGSKAQICVYIVLPFVSNLEEDDICVDVLKYVFKKIP